MKIYIYDTYVKSKDGHTMHFDVITDKKDNNKTIEFAKRWLASIGEKDTTVTTKECQFCHSQDSPESVVQAIKKEGYFIQKMEGCS